MVEKIKSTQCVMFLIVVILLNFGVVQGQIKTFEVGSFDKIIVSPHISATFRKGDTESITVKNINIPIEKFKTELEGTTLRVFLEGARIFPKSEKEQQKNWKNSHSVYDGTVANIEITYKNLQKLSVRGDETFVSEGVLKAEQFLLSVYGASRIYFDSVAIKKMKATVYGESYLKIKKGRIDEHKIVAYGECKVHALNIRNKEAKVICYGEGSFQLNVEETLKVTAYGEATVAYKGDPEIRKGVVIGEATIEKIR